MTRLRSRVAGAASFPVTGGEAAPEPVQRRRGEEGDGGKATRRISVLLSAFVHRKEEMVSIICIIKFTFTIFFNINKVN